MVENKEQSVF